MQTDRLLNEEEFGKGSDIWFLSSFGWGWKYRIKGLRTYMIPLKRGFDARSCEVGSNVRRFLEYGKVNAENDEESWTFRVRLSSWWRRVMEFGLWVEDMFGLEYGSRLLIVAISMYP